MNNVQRIGGSLLLVALAACSRNDAPPAAPAPVLVVQPTGEAAVASAGYPGESHARKESPLSFRVGGILLRRHVDAGAVVKSGQVLAELDVSDYAQQVNAAQAQYAAAEADLVRARNDHKRYSALADQQLVSRSALDAQTAALKAAQGQADAARANLALARNQNAYAQLRAPADGVIASRLAEAGQVVGAGQAIFTLAAAGEREVAISVPEGAIAQFEVGQPVEVELWNQPGRRWQGTVREIAAGADPQARTYATRVSLEADAAAVVELGQSAKVFVRDARAVPMSVPLAAVLKGSDGKPSVFVVNPADGKLQARAIEVGADGADRVPVTAGLKPDEWVVAAGGHLLRPGQQVTALDRHNKAVLAPAAAPAKGD